LHFGGRCAPTTSISFLHLQSFQLVAGIVGGAANLLLVAATGCGELSLVAVTTSLYPATTVLPGRTVLGKRWTRLQTIRPGRSALPIIATTLTWALPLSLQHLEQ
jgi:uncharacterized membrane protein